MFRSTGDYDSANLLFKQYSSFDSEMSKVQKDSFEHPEPRAVEVQPNLFLNEKN